MQCKENNPESMSALGWRLGLSRAVKFIGIYRIDEPENDCNDTKTLSRLIARLFSQ
jgi:hypothetical protein